MTRQQAYETVRAYLTRPGARQCLMPYPGETALLGCAYGSVIDGVQHHCAIGVLLDASDQELMCAPDCVSGLIEHYPQVKGMLGEIAYDKHFLDTLQLIHDTNDNWDLCGFKVSVLDDWAEGLGLIVPVGIEHLDFEPEADLVYV